MSEQAVVHLQGVPPSWQNRRGHWRWLAAQKRPWRDRTHMLAQSARHEVGWEKPVKDSLSKVSIVLHRVRMLDHDNAYSSIKPVVDGLEGALIYSDAPQFCQLTVLQRQVHHFADQETVITVERQ